MPNFCQDKLRFEIGDISVMSLKNGNLVTGRVIGTFQNKVQLGGTPGTLVVRNSSGSVVPVATNFIEVFCDDIVAVSGGEASEGGEK